MKYYTSEISENSNLQRTAFSKARQDIEEILENEGWKKIEIPALSCKKMKLI